MGIKVIQEQNDKDQLCRVALEREYRTNKVFYQRKELIVLNSDLNLASRRFFTSFSLLWHM